MNCLTFASVFLKLAYNEYAARVVDSAVGKDEFADYARLLALFDALSLLDALLYYLIANSFVKALVYWQPGIFKLFQDLLGHFFDRRSLLILLSVVGFATVGTALLGAALGPFVFGFQSVSTMTVRGSVMGSQGWFWQISREYGITEDLPSMEGNGLPLLYGCLTVYSWVVTIVCTAVFIGKVIDDLAKSRK